MDFTRSIEQTSGLQSAIARNIHGVSADVMALSNSIHSDPEVAFEERRAADSISEFLATRGFRVKKGVAGLPTAFTAQAGSGPTTVGICIEYDALPGVGHACGHNLIAGASIATALGLLPLVEDLGITIKLIGTPAEERGGGKIILLEQGIFDDVTFAMMFHPIQDGISRNPIGTTSQALGRYRATFRGKAAHAAAGPHLGVNAADAAVIAQVAVGLLRQQLPDTYRVALFVSEGGQATNIIPDRAQVDFECRTFSMSEYDSLLRRVRNCFEAGATATGADLEIVETASVYEPLLQNEVLGGHWNEGMAFFGRDIERSAGLSGGSTDMGNISNVIPSIHPWVGIPGTTAVIHSREFATVADSPMAYQIMFESAISMAWTVARVMADGAQVARYLAAADARTSSVAR
ncbi:MAG: M20 family metallopeptidase [Terrimesophilobacter sp.]